MGGTATAEATRPQAASAAGAAPARLRSPDRVAFRNPLYRVAGRMLCVAMRLVPRRYRFTAAARLAGLLVPVLRRTRLHEGLRYMRVNSDRDLTLNLLLTSMTASGTPFDLALDIEGEQILRDALASGRGTVIVAPHALLSLLILRYLHDQGHAPTIVGSKKGIPLAGTPLVAPTVPNTPHVLVVLRSRLRAGGIVCAMVDRLLSKGKKTLAFESPVGQIRVSEAIFRLAVRCDAQVLFTATRAEKRGVRLTIAAPRPASAGSADAITADFISFVQAHARAIG